MKKRKIKIWWKKNWKWLLPVVVVVVGGVIWFYSANCNRGKEPEWGINFSQKYAAWLNNGDWQQVYLQILDNFKPKKMRLMAYWDVVEKYPGQFNFSELDWQLRQAEDYDTEIVLAIGYRVPRWPECHIPTWAQKLSTEEQQAATLGLLKKTVERYRDKKQIIGWQVENEPFFMQSFGLCPPVDKDFYKKEVAFVRSLDERPIYGTESGELSTWTGTAGTADYIGTSIYRVVWSPFFGFFTYPIPPAYYYFKTQIVKSFYPVKNVVVSEMQMEPWLPGTSVWDTSVEEQLKILGPGQFEKNINYARRTGLSPVYLWGAEWWYWLKQRGYSQIWNTAEKLMTE